MGEEQDSHHAEVNRPTEHERMARVYAGYGVSARKGRAWDAANAGNVAIRDELVAAVMELAGELIEGDGVLLDVGCGTGWWLERLLRAGVGAPRLAGVELLAERVRAASSRVPGADIRRADARQLPLAQDSCSLITLFTVLSAMGGPQDVEACLLEARRVLVPGGAVAVWEPRWPTPNRHTHLIRVGQLRSTLGGRLSVRTITLAPPLARRCAGFYGPLARIAPLRSHRLIIARP